MERGTATRVVASSLASAGFAVALFAGLAADNSADAIVSRGLTAMLACYIAGWCIGVVAERAVDERLASERGAPNQTPDTQKNLSADAKI